MQKVGESRDRKRPLKVLVSERERAEIETRAGATGLLVSAYLPATASRNKQEVKRKSFDANAMARKLTVFEDLGTT